MLQRLQSSYHTIGSVNGKKKEWKPDERGSRNEGLGSWAGREGCAGSDKYRTII